MWQTIIHKYLHIPYRLHIYSEKRVKKPRITVVLLHGMGYSGVAWDELVARLPDDVRALSIDLLGFGDSPNPKWLKYDIKVQARAVARTLLQSNIRQRVVVIGHSMGSLTAIELARRYPLAVQSLILCAPPLYTETEQKTFWPSQQKILKDFYKIALKRPAQLAAATPLAVKLRIVGKAFNVTKENVEIYLSALQSSILRQTSMNDLVRIKKRVDMITGTLDPLVVKKNVKTASQASSNFSHTSVLAGHELTKPYVDEILKRLKES